MYFSNMIFSQKKLEKMNYYFFFVLLVLIICEKCCKFEVQVCNIVWFTKSLQHHFFKTLAPLPKSWQYFTLQHALISLQNLVTFFCNKNVANFWFLQNFSMFKKKAIVKKKYDKGPACPNHGRHYYKVSYYPKAVRTSSTPIYTNLFCCGL